MAMTLNSDDIQAIAKAIHGRTCWYVDHSVGSSGDGKSPSTAVKTIAEALALKTSGDIIFINHGTYSESVNFSGLEVRGGNKDNTIITSGTQSTPAITIGAGTILRGIQGVHTGSSQSSGKNIAIYGAGADNAILNDVLGVAENGQGIYVQGNNVVMDHTWGIGSEYGICLDASASFGCCYVEHVYGYTAAWTMCATDAIYLLGNVIGDYVMGIASGGNASNHAAGIFLQDNAAIGSVILTNFQGYALKTTSNLNYGLLYENSGAVTPAASFRHGIAKAIGETGCYDISCSLGSAYVSDVQYDSSFGTVVVHPTNAKMVAEEVQDRLDGTTPIDIDSFANLTKECAGTITVTGSDGTTYDGVYYPVGQYGDQPYWSTTGEDTYYIWKDTSGWAMSAALGVTGTNYYSLAGTSPIGTWVGHGAYTATPTTTGYPLVAAVNLAAAGKAAATTAKTQTTATAIRAVLGLATANLDTQLSGLEGSGLTEAQAAQLTNVEEKTALITTATLNFVNLFDSRNRLTLVRGMDHCVATGYQIDLANLPGAILTGADPVTLSVKRKGESSALLSVEGEVTGEHALRFEVLKADTDSVTPSEGDRWDCIYDAWAKLATGEEFTVRLNDARILDRVKA